MEVSYFISGPEGGSWDKIICSPHGETGIPGAGAGHGRYPASWLVDLVSAGVCEAGRLAPASLSASSPTVEGQLVPSPSAPSQREPAIPPLLILLEHWGNRRCPHKRCPFPWTPLRPSLAPQEALSFQQYCRGVLLSPATSLSLHILPDPSSE